jgi:TonB-dependent SusC/RagA subfamily outer membrane receptor
MTGAPEPRSIHRPGLSHAAFRLSENPVFAPAAAPAKGGMMKRIHGSSVALLLLLAACGGSGLPPAGPRPGEVDDGFGTKPADKSTGAVSTVTAKPPMPLRLEDLLRGKAAGVQVITRPDGQQRLRIRGGNLSLTPDQAEQDPLIIVDGVPIAQDALSTALAGLTVDEIKQVDVLKDAASTAVYGTRGAAGVIVINTTRR